jgi:two-component system sensor histidine kinase PilS (NtrC family)
MSVSQIEQSLVSEVIASTGDRPEVFWRLLFFFNAYRLTVAVLLLAGIAIWGNTLQFGSRDTTLFVITAGIYVLLSIASFALIRIRWRFNRQLTLQVAADIAVIVILIYASNGVSSGLGLLLLTSLAAGGLISRGRLALFHAALASIAVLLEHTFEVLVHDANFALFVQVGMLSGGYFATAWLTHTLARRALVSEQLAARREIDLENMAQVNQLVIRDMQDGVLVVDGNGVIRQFNDRAERILGPLRGRREVQLSEYSQALALHLGRWLEDATGLDAASEMTLNRDLSVRFVPVSNSRSVGAVIFLEDLTRVQAEARQMKLAALGRLTANIAHEIRNPLGAISHAAELLQEEPSISVTTTRLLTIIHDNSRRLDRMVNDVLKLNRGDHVQRETFKVIDYVMSFIDQFCQIEKIPPELFEIVQIADPVILFDRSHFNQVMWNLCRNALRHCLRGKASIRIVVSTERDGSVVKLDVIDDGAGVPVVARSQLFEPFVTTVTGGTGLGLYLAREVCEANGATLEYVETSGGAQFTVLCRAG